MAEQHFDDLIVAIGIVAIVAAPQVQGARCRQELERYRRSIARALAAAKQLRDQPRREAGAGRRRQEGADAGFASAMRTLTGDGFEPIVEGESIMMRNCPFEGVAADNPVPVWGVIAALKSASSKHLSTYGITSAVEPANGRYCGRLHLSTGQRHG